MPFGGGGGNVTTRQNVEVADAYGSVVGICSCEAKKERKLDNRSTPSELFNRLSHVRYVDYVVNMLCCDGGIGEKSNILQILQRP